MNNYETNQISKNINYWYSIDLLKGILIIFVFLGHIIPGIQRTTFPRYIIYSFHMPLFIGVSGFLFNISKKNLSFKKISIKYLKRMIIPWFIALTCYFIVNNIISMSPYKITWQSFANEFIHPYYHLWYIPGLISYITIINLSWKMLKKYKAKWFLIFFISIVISIISNFDLAKKFATSYNIKKLCAWIHDSFRLYNLIFFTLGIYLRYKYEQSKNIIPNKMVKFIRIFMYVSIYIVIILFFFNFSNVEKLMYFIMNIFALLVILNDCITIKIPRNTVIEFIGKYSLPIYLYHIFCKILAKNFFVEGSLKYYFVCIISFVFLCIIVYLLRNIAFIDKIIFGSSNDHFTQNKK